MAINFSFSIYSILLECYLLFCSCLLLLFGVFLSTNLNWGYLLINKNVQYLFLQILILGIILIYNQYPIYLITWNSLLINNSFSFYSKIFILLISMLWFIISLDCILKEKIHNFEYWVLILLNILAVLLITQVYDLLSTYLVIEFQSLIFYILASFKRNSEFSTESGIKYFVLGASSSSFLLFGFSLLYSSTGLTNFNDLLNFFIDCNLITNLNINSTIFLSVTLILISLLFKLSAAPFHMWAPDVYEGAPSSITAFFSIISKLPILSLLLKFTLFIFYDLFNFWSSILTFSIILSAIIGTFSAFAQIKWKRFIAYSSVSHVSFFLLAIISNNLESVNNLFIYLIIYLFMVIGFFAFFLNFYHYKFPFFSQLRFLKNLNLLVIINPILVFSLGIILFSMAGIPPLAGFFSKFFILFSAVANNAFYTIFIVLICNCIGCFYYLRLVKSVYFDFNTPKLFLVLVPLSKFNASMLGLSIYLIIFLFLNFDLLFLFTNLLSFSFL
uniref:NADH dehydrogenase subunit 2 n=1 Tax=Dasya binghamiae TaxID=1896963 RepID=A0A1C8XRT9_9FLOR|nr:NADH dehydrogenase subunit 2 [Dasya binghamiae]AOH77194.1 NADH dehydrogenase subunit 2 [Dasya binghamiae]